MNKRYETAFVQFLAVDAKDVLAMTSGNDISEVSDPNQTEWDKKVGIIK